jgi:hypothetical protein
MSATDPRNHGSTAPSPPAVPAASHSDSIQGHALALRKQFPGLSAAAALDTLRQMRHPLGNGQLLHEGDELQRSIYVPFGIVPVQHVRRRAAWQFPHFCVAAADWVEEQVADE